MPHVKFVLYIVWYCHAIAVSNPVLKVNLDKVYIVCHAPRQFNVDYQWISSCFVVTSCSVVSSYQLLCLR